MNACKNVIILGTIMMSALGFSQSYGQIAGAPGATGGYSVGVDPQAPKSNYFPNTGYQTPIPSPGASVLQPSQTEPGQNVASWPNYPYPQHHNPYYDGGSPGNMVSGAIDWALSFPSSVWDRLSEFLDYNVFPRSPATHGGGPQVQSIAPQNSGQQPQNLPPAKSYNPGDR
ncbi:MAG: hypothetical protein NTY51_05645 [Deltaproteobacteria bacterium]|nr:hypothetical protein [Deltaproteobacteria bacterium]